MLWLKQFKKKRSKHLSTTFTFIVQCLLNIDYNSHASELKEKMSLPFLQYLWIAFLETNLKFMKSSSRSITRNSYKLSHSKVKKLYPKFEVKLKFLNQTTHQDVVRDFLEKHNLIDWRWFLKMDGGVEAYLPLYSSKIWTVSPTFRDKLWLTIGSGALKLYTAKNINKTIVRQITTHSLDKLLFKLNF